MNNDTTVAVDEYIALYRRIRDELGSDEPAMLVLEQIGKDRRSAMLAAEGNHGAGGNGGDPEPTEKQLAFLKRLGIVEIPKTKRSASELIDQAKAAM